MTNSIIAAKFAGLKNYTIEYIPAVDIQIFGTSFAKAGELNAEELANLEIDYPNFNVFTYYATVPNVKRNFLPIIGKMVRDIIGVSNKELLIIDLKKFITNTPEIKNLVKSGYYDSKKLSYNRVLAIKVLLLRNLELMQYTYANKDKIVITKDQIQFPNPGDKSKEGLQDLIHEALGSITVEEIVKVYQTINPKTY